MLCWCWWWSRWITLGAGGGVDEGDDGDEGDEGGDIDAVEWEVGGLATRKTSLSSPAPPETGHRDHDEEHPGLDQGYHSPVLPGCVKIIIVFLLFWLWLLYVNSIYSMGIVSGHHWKPLKGSEQFWNSPTVHFISGPYFVMRNEELTKLKVLIQNSNIILWLFWSSLCHSW